MRHRFVICVLIAVFGRPAVAQSIPAPIEPAEPIQGALVIAGGGTTPDVIYEHFIKLAGGDKARLVIIPTAADNVDPPLEAKLLESWRKRGVVDVHVLHTRAPEQAGEPEFIKPLANATGVWLDGGQQTRLVTAYKGTAVEREMNKLLGRGGVIGGTSAGAAVMSRLMIAGGKVPPQLGEGFGFLPAGVVDQHFLKRDRADRLVYVLSKHPGWFGLGIDEGTAVVVQGRLLTVIGQSYAVVVQAAGRDRPAGFQVLQPGDKADLIALSRAALERTRAVHPPIKAPIPAVAKGSLLIGGGGGLPTEIWQKFIELAGGPEAKIVFVPTALDFPLKGVNVEAKRLKDLGAKHVTILHAKSRAEANSAEFCKVIDEASAVWFSGGRQWRFVDAYLDTAAQSAFQRVLERGGVISGSSAGASIQADYMVRGDPLGNLKMMAEGYERGLGFLKGVAIDQHFLKRKRTADMTEVMARHPQLLGIGIDEATALFVQGEVMQVLGKSNVLVYDRTRHAIAPHDYEVLVPGDRYQMRERRKHPPQ